MQFFKKEFITLTLVLVFCTITSALASEEDFERIRNDIWYTLTDNIENSDAQAMDARTSRLRELFSQIPDEYSSEFYNELGGANNGGEFSQVFHDELTPATTEELLGILSAANSSGSSEQTVDENEGQTETEFTSISASEKEFERIRVDVWNVLYDLEQNGGAGSPEESSELLEQYFSAIPAEFANEFYDELGAENNGGVFSELYHGQLSPTTAQNLLSTLLELHASINNQSSSSNPNSKLIEGYYEDENSDYGTWSMPTVSTKLDSIYYHYATACYGMDWRVLKAFSIAESNERPNLQNRSGYQGLGQWKTKDCVGPNYITEFIDADGDAFLTCDDLLDPEANVAATAGRLHRFFKGERLRNKTVSYNEQQLNVHYLKRDNSWKFPLATRCPGVAPEDMAAYSYVGHNNGPGVLKAVLRQGVCAAGDMDEAVTAMRNANPTEAEKSDYQTADVQWKAIWSWYDRKDPASTSERAKINARLASRNLPEYLHLRENDGHYAGVGGRYGIYKWRYGHRKITPHIIAQDIEELYPAGALNPTICPAVTQQRVYPRDDFPVEACKPWKSAGNKGDCTH